MTEMTAKTQPNARPTKLASFLGAFLLSVGLSIGCYVPGVLAYNCGDVVYPGSSWLNQNGVPSRSNAGDETTGSSCGSFVNNLNATPPQMGSGWQCVEMAQRFYNTETWYSGDFAHVSVAADIYTNASLDGWTTMAQGSITLSSIVPGDMLVTNEDGGVGHVFIVDTVNTANNTIGVVDQNAGDGGHQTVSFDSSTKELSDGSYFQFMGVVHSPYDTLSSGVNSIAFALINGVYNIFSGTASGTITDTYWGSGTNLGTQTEWTGLGDITSIAFYEDSNGHYNVLSGTSSGVVNDTYWGNGLSNGNTPEYTGLGSITSVAFDNISGVYNIFSGNTSGTINDTYWGTGYSQPGNSSEASQLGTINGIAFSLIGGVYNVFSGTSGGYVYDTYWGNGNNNTNYIPYTGLGDVTSVAFQDIGGVYNILSGTSGGQVNDTYWGNGNNNTNYVPDTGLGSITSVAFIDDSGVYHILSGTSGGSVNDTFWGSGHSNTNYAEASQLGPISGVAFDDVSGTYNLFSGTTSDYLYDTYWTPLQNNGQNAIEFPHS